MSTPGYADGTALCANPDLEALRLAEVFVPKFLSGAFKSLFF